MTGTVFGVRRLRGGGGARGGLGLLALVTAVVAVGPVGLAAGTASASTSTLASSSKSTSTAGTGTGRGTGTQKHPHKALTPEQAAKAALLTLANMPTGWVAISKAPKSSHTAPLSKQLAKCIGVPASVATTKPLKVSSPDFTSTDRTAAVEDSVSAYTTSAQAKTAFKAMARAKTPMCIGNLGASALRTSIQAEAGTNATVGAITINPLPTSALQAKETGFEVSIPLDSNGQDLTISSIQVDFQEGKLLQQLTFNGNGAPFNLLEEVHLVQAAQRQS